MLYVKYKTHTFYTFSMGGSAYQDGVESFMSLCLLLIFSIINDTFYGVQFIFGNVFYFAASLHNTIKYITHMTHNNEHRIKTDTV